MAILTRTKTVAVLAAAALVTTATALWAQAAAQTPDPGSLAALTAEIRQLRLAVEESGRAQGQTQALTVYISAQRDRMVQMANRADAANKELEAAATAASEMANQLTHIERNAAAPGTSPGMRLAMTQEIEGVRAEVARRRAQEQALRTRVLEMTQGLQVEEARWADLISRLEQTIRR
jgi:hypothetical protein